MHTRLQHLRASRALRKGCQQGLHRLRIDQGLVGQRHDDRVDPGRERSQADTHRRGLAVARRRVVRQIADHAVVADQHDRNPLMHARTTRANWFEKLLFAPHYEHYHLEHHLMPTAPCWNLPKLHAVLEKDGVIPEQNQADSLIGVLRRAAV